MQLGARKARYFGRRKTFFQLMIAATVANLTPVATKTGLMRGPGGGKNAFSFHFSRIFDAIRAFLSRFSTAFRLRGAFRPAENPAFGHVSRARPGTRGARNYSFVSTTITYG